MKLNTMITVPFILLLLGITGGVVSIGTNELSLGYWPGVIVLVSIILMFIQTKPRKKKMKKFLFP